MPFPAAAQVQCYDPGMRDVWVRKSARLMLIVLLAVGLLSLWARQIDDGPIISDAAQWLQVAVNLERHGIFSLDAAPPLKPTNFREPLPSATTAAAIAITDALDGKAPESAYFSGPRLRGLKYQNLFWLALLTIGAFWIAADLTASWGVGLFTAVLVNVPFRPHFPPGLIDDLMTEIPFAAMLMLASGALALGVARRSLPLLFTASVLFGAMTLTKALTLYIFLVLLLIVLGRYLLERALLRSHAKVELTLLILPFVLVVVPWMLRNHAELGTYQITQRASFALVERSFEDQISPLEYKGAIYLWAPFMKTQLGRWLGYSPEDLLPGGRLQRLNDDPDSAISKIDEPFELSADPDKITTFYRKARADVQRSKLGFEAAGRPFPGVDAEALQTARGIAAIRAQPFRHLALTLLLLWRTSAESLVILSTALLAALLLRRSDLALFVLPSLGLVLGYALVSNDVPRYDVPMHLVSIAVLPILAVLSYRSMRGFSNSSTVGP
jgi:hypothetical protein